ncbi:MAG: glycosyltransferase [Lachnospiraceae bacterium]|jgi:glycosyltransferase involved in cell wall biosynthesis|nr:glycosyltransferase [Lachnospiraceae bacterium]
MTFIIQIIYGLNWKDLNVYSIKFSIITVTYNCSKTIERTILSVLSQSYPNIDYVIIDGASTDGTKDILKKYTNKLSYVISEPDNGIYHAMNKGIEASSGDYLLFLNGDDYFYSDDVLERINPYCKGNNIVIGREYCGSRLSDIVDLGNVQSKYYGIFYPHQATFIPKKVFDSIGEYSLDYSVSADFEWICRAIYNKTEISWVNEVVSHYTIGGVSSRINCDIDEYSISLKYMMLCGEKCFIPDLIRYTREKAKNTIFREILQDNILCERIKNELDKNIDTHKGVSLWGAGFLSGLYIEMFNRIGISVNYIIDKREDVTCLAGIPIVKYKKELVCQLFITTEVFDDEIAAFLEKEGFRNEMDYFSQKSFRDRMIRSVMDDYKSIKKFENASGIKLFS